MIRFIFDQAFIPSLKYLICYVYFRFGSVFFGNKIIDAFFYSGTIWALYEIYKQFTKKDDFELNDLLEHYVDIGICLQWFIIFLLGSIGIIYLGVNNLQINNFGVESLFNELSGNYRPSLFFRY